MQAYSLPITPAPTTASDCGNSCRSSSSSESWTRGCSNGIPGGPDRGRPDGDDDLVPAEERLGPSGSATGLCAGR